MKLISSRDALNFLSAAAPRPWVKRTLLWMMLDDGLSAFFTRGLIRPHTAVMHFTADLYKEVGEWSGPTMDAKIAEHFDEEFASKLIGRDQRERVYDESTEWGEHDEPHAVSVGFFIFAAELDWEGGTLATDLIPFRRERPDFLFWDEEQHLGSEFDNPDFEVSLSGMSFDASVIEMLLPSSTLVAPGTAVSGLQHAVGRPRKWDWEGAMAHVVSLAQHPDGLPTGPGAQARIEAMIADWFSAEEGNAPAVSQIRQRAQTIIRNIAAEK